MTREEAYNSSFEYFGGDDMAASVFLQKYALKDNEGNFVEANPSDTHRRLAKEYARIEAKYGGKHQLSEDRVFRLLDRFAYIIPGGSVMSSLGKDNGSVESLSNCFVIGRFKDSYASIMKYRDYMVELEKRRGGVGLDMSSLRPEGTKVNNAAVTSTGPVSFLNGFSELSKEVAQGGRRK